MAMERRSYWPPPRSLAVCCWSVLTLARCSSRSPALTTTRRRASPPQSWLRYGNPRMEIRACLLDSWLAAYDRNRGVLSSGVDGFPKKLFERADTLRAELLVSTTD